MRFLILTHRLMADGDHAAYAEDLGDWVRSMIDAGVFVHGEPLRGLEAATSVRRVGAGTVTEDPARAVVGTPVNGVYMIECRDREAAVDIAAQLPDSRTGWVEVRPVDEELAAMVRARWQLKR